MKGIMVSLLIFLTTGIVVGQQSNSSNNSFNNPTKRGPINFGPKTSSDLHKPLEIAAPLDLAQKLREGRILKAPVEARGDNNELLDSSVINGVSIYQKGRSTNSLNPVSVEGRTNGNGVLQFALTDRHLEALESGQLNYKFSNSELGAYERIDIFYAGQPTAQATNQTNNNPVSQPRAPFPEENGNFKRFVPISKPQNQFSNRPYIALPGPASPGEENFMGPVRPTSNWQPPGQIAQDNSRFNQNLNAGKTDNRFTPAGNPDPDFAWRAKQRLDQERLEKIRNDEKIAQAQKDYQYNQWLANEEARKAQEARDAQMALDQKRQAELVAWRRQIESKTQLSPIGREQPILTGPKVNPWDSMTYEQQQKELALREKERLLNSRETSLLRQNDLIASEKARLDSEKLQLLRDRELRSYRAEDYTPDWNKTATREFGTEFYPTKDGPIIERRPDRFASKDSRTPVGPIENDYQDRTKDIKGFAASIPYGSGNAGSNIPTNGNGSSTAQKRDDRIDGFVLFLLLCSLGLNAYLAFISRGFYVRYNELADELRETFSATL